MTVLVNDPCNFYFGRKARVLSRHRAGMAEVLVVAIGNISFAIAASLAPEV